MPEPSDLQSEQAHVDRAYARLDAMRAAAAARRDEVIGDSRGGTHQAREERDVIVRSALARIEQLRLGDEALSFGRIDRTTGERFYIGRLAVSDVDQEPLIVDWRAPVAEPFYRATGRHSMGLSRRRHFITDGRRIVGMEDELLDLDHLPDESTLAGEGALLAALERSRSGAMRDIVGTIQAEQDDIIRAPMPGVLVVQGGPGTGKTAVALHRAAYLLYTYRFPLERQGVLVVGPNPLFLRYIEHVLPSLGETGVTLSTVAGLYAGNIRPRSADRALAARVKGDVRMAKVLAKAVADRQRPLRSTVEIPYGSYKLRLTPELTRDVVRAAKRRPGTHNGRRPQVEQMLVQRLHHQYTQAVDRTARAGIRANAPKEAQGYAEFAEDLRDSVELKEVMERIWPLLLPEELVHDLFGARPLIELAAVAGQLAGHERAALHRPRATALEDIPWTAADVPLLDEAAVLLGPRRRRADKADSLRTFGHVVVDEAQDLSPMQLRMLARRSLGGSMTVVGDIGQATGPFSPAGWGDILAHLPNRKPSRQVELTVNYRTPSEIMEVAARVLAQAAPHLVPPQSVRSAGFGPAVRRIEGGEDVTEVALAVAAALRDEVQGTVAVICPPSLAGPLGAAKEDDVSLEDEVSIVPVGSVKGLEFDGVVVVEPGLIADESPQGLRALYVSLTRATRRLTIVHEAPLPAVLGL
ncbi:MAG TPA: AAA family ATPase [Acidimicrobiales bacterium]|nr:AAA family ATPase [Acidimicrobiales bacterium]